MDRKFEYMKLSYFEAQDFQFKRLQSKFTISLNITIKNLKNYPLL